MGFSTAVTPSVAVRTQPVNIAYNNKPSAVQYRVENADLNALAAQQFTVENINSINTIQYALNKACVLFQKYADLRDDRCAKPAASGNAAMNRAN